MAYPWRGGRARVLVPVASHPPSLAAPLLRRSFLTAALTEMRLLLSLLVGLAACEDWADSPALTKMWETTSSSDLDGLIQVLAQGGRDMAHARSADGRGPLFWAYEYKNSDVLALLTHLEVDETAEDADGKRPSEFFPDVVKNVIVKSVEVKQEARAMTSR